MKNTKTYILTALIGILLGSISIWLMPGALAQDASTAQIQVEVKSGCTWDGAPYASNLTVYDDDICILTDVHNVGAYNVLVENDVSSSNQAGGKLIVGTDTVSTDITFGGTMTMNGILEIGVSGDPAANSNLQIDGASAISSTGSNGDLDILSNSNTDSTCGGGSDPCGNNTIELGSALTIAGALTGGTFTNNDDATTSTISSISIYGATGLNYGILENLAGTITVTNQIDMYGYGAINNDATLTLGNVASYWNNYTSADNSGTFNSPNTINIYSSSTITNSGTWNGGTLYFTGSGTSANTGTLNLATLNFISSGTFNNNGTGDINITSNIVLNSGGTINNNDTGTVTVDSGTYIYSETSDINNYNSWETDLMQMGIPAGTHGGTFNNYGTLAFPAPSTYGVNIHSDGILANQSTGVITLSTSIYMEGAGAADLATITNTNTTTNAIDIAGQINMDAYSLINNSGYISTAGTNNIDIQDNNADITNTTGSYINLEGANQTFDFDVTVNNDGTINTVAASLILSDTAALNNTTNGIVDINGAVSDLTLNISASIDNAGSIIVPDDTAINDDAHITQSAGTFTTTDLLLTDATPTTPYLTMTGGTVTAAADLRVYDGSTVNINDGTLTADTMYIGIVATQDGGTINVDSTGALDVRTGGYNHIYKGTLDIKATSTASTPFIYDDRLYVNGDAVEKGIVNHYGSGTVHGYIWSSIYEYGELNIDNGTWNNHAQDLNILSNTAGDVHGELNIGTNGTLTGFNILYIGTYDYGVFQYRPGGNVVNNGNIVFAGGSNNVIRLRWGGRLENYGTIDLGTLGYVQMDTRETAPYWTATGRSNYFLNDTGASYKGNNLFMYDNNDDAGNSHEQDNLVDNNGSIVVYYQLDLGNESYDGGIFNNNSSVEVGYRLNVYRGGVYNNNADATTTGITSGTPNTMNALTVSGTDGLSNRATYNQFEGTDAPSQAYKTATESLAFNAGGDFNNYDYISAGNLNMASGVTDANFNCLLGASATQDAYANIIGTSTIYGKVLVEGDATDYATYDSANAAWLYATGEFTNNGIVNFTTSQNNFENKGGKIFSGIYSTFNLPGLSPGFEHETGAFTEFAGTVNASSIEADGGYMCFGKYTGTYPTGSCTHSSTGPATEFTEESGVGGDKIFDVNGTIVDISNNMTFLNGTPTETNAFFYAYNGAVITQSVDSFIDLQDNVNLEIAGSSSSFTSNGNMDIQGSGLGNHGFARLTQGGDLILNGTTYNIGSVWMRGGTGGGEANLNIGVLTTLNLNDTHTAGTYTNVAISTGVENLAGSEAVYAYGTLNLNSNSTQHIALGVDSPSSWNVDGLIIFNGGSFQHTGTSSGNLDINQSAIFYVGNDGTAAIDTYINGTATIGANYGYDQNGPHGAYIDGDFECETTLTIEDDGLLDVALTGDVTVAGSTTDVYGLVELDGTLNGGDVTVYSGGIISSGDGASPLSAPTWPTYQGCGPGGVFGCGSGTSFDLNASTLDVQSGGLIVSDGVSTQDRDNINYAHGGSYGGEGVANGTPDTTHDNVKASSPLYGDQGEKASDGFGGHGGGGVHIDVTGTDGTSDGRITINGEISADGYSATYDIDYGSRTTNFTIGSILSSATGAGIIVNNVDAGGGAGTLTYYLTSGSFSSGQALSDDAGGAATATSNPTYNDGGGAGGTVIINQTPFDEDTTFTGSGTISAHGGNGTYPGGGGRIVISSPLLDDPDFASYDFGEDGGTVHAYGGLGVGERAAAGTIVYMADRHNTDDTLIIDQGGLASATSAQTDLADSPTFDRIEVKNAADADLTGATTQVCYKLDTSNVDGITCDGTTALPDKPDHLHIQATWTGTTPATATEEPGYQVADGVSNSNLQVADLGPVFAMYFRNPGDTLGDYEVVEIQVATDVSFTTLLWDATVGGADGEVTLNTPVSDGEWTEDIEYGGTTLAKSTTYYVRARFREDAISSPGLWTHGDYNSQYKFEIIEGSNLTIENCNNDPTGLKITQDGTGTGTDLSPISGQRYGYGTCDVHFATTETSWEVYLSMATGETGLVHTNPAYDINHIANGAGDCSIDNTGTSSDEEWGYNLTTYTDTTDNTVANSNVKTDTECNTVCTIAGKYNESQAVSNADNCYFDLETLANKDTILDTDVSSASAVNDAKFTTTIHANAYNTTAGDYSTVMEATITTNP